MNTHDHMINNLYPLNNDSNVYMNINHSGCLSVTTSSWQRTI